MIVILPVINGMLVFEWKLLLIRGNTIIRDVTEISELSIVTLQELKLDFLCLNRLLSKQEVSRVTRVISFRRLRV
jgi:hypothetical protein